MERISEMKTISENVSEKQSLNIHEQNIKISYLSES